MIEILQIIFQIFLLVFLTSFPLNKYLFSNSILIKKLNFFTSISINSLFLMFLLLIFSFFKIDLISVFSLIIFAYLIMFLKVLFNRKNIFRSNELPLIFFFLFSIIVISDSFVEAIFEKPFGIL